MPDLSMTTEGDKGGQLHHHWSRLRVLHVLKKNCSKLESGLSKILGIS